MPDVKGCSLGMSRTLSILPLVPLGLPLLLAYFSAQVVQLLVCRPVRGQCCVVACYLASSCAAKPMHMRTPVPSGWPRETGQLRRGRIVAENEPILKAAIL